MQLEYPIVNYLRKVNGQHIVNQQLQLGVYFSTEIMLHNGRINQQVFFFAQNQQVNMRQKSWPWAD